MPRVQYRERAQTARSGGVRMSARRRATYDAPIRPDWTPETLHRSPLVAVAGTFLFFVAVLAVFVVVMVVIR